MMMERRQHFFLARVRIISDRGPFVGPRSRASFRSARTASDRLRMRFSNLKLSIAASSSLLTSIVSRLADCSM